MTYTDRIMNDRKCKDCCNYKECNTHSIASISERVYLLVREGKDCWEPLKNK